jgi:hypothetical protein
VGQFSRAPKKRARDAAAALFGKAHVDEKSRKNELLADLRTVFRSHGTGDDGGRQLTSAVARAALAELEARPWEGITARQVSDCSGPTAFDRVIFGLRVRPKRKALKGYIWSDKDDDIRAQNDCGDAFRRHLRKRVTNPWRRRHGVCHKAERSKPRATRLQSLAAGAAPSRAAA